MRVKRVLRPLQWLRIIQAFQSLRFAGASQISGFFTDFFAVFFVFRLDFFAKRENSKWNQTFSPA